MHTDAPSKPEIHNWFQTLNKDAILVTACTYIIVLTLVENQDDIEAEKSVIGRGWEMKGWKESECVWKVKSSVGISLEGQENKSDRCQSQWSLISC